MNIKETLNTPIVGEYDVIVAGGGVAGVAAALSASRCGSKVLLIEKSYILGGLGTSGIVTIYLPICDGCGHQVSFGLAEELLKVSIEDACENLYPKAWLEGGTLEEKISHRYQTQYNPFLCAIVWEKLLLKENVDILYGSFIANTTVENHRITSLIVENISGRGAYTCKNVIDATGDAVVAKLSGEDTVEYGLGNILASWFYDFSKEKGYNLNMLGFCETMPEDREDTEEIHERKYKGLDGKEISEFMYNSHASLYNKVMEMRKSDPSYLPVNTASIPQLRMTRGLKGEYLMSINDDKKDFPDSVGLFSNWKKRGPIYELPFSTLHGSQIKNLLVCGRAMGAEDSMWDVTRVIPVCSVTGEACGVASSFGDWDKVSISSIQKKLKENGVKLKIGAV